MKNSLVLNFCILTMMTLIAMFGLALLFGSLFLWYQSLNVSNNISIVYNVEIVNVVKPEVKAVAKAPQKKTSNVQPIDEDTYQLARIIHAEAKGESYSGKLAVGNVVLNRVSSDQFPNTIEGVIFQSGQFSPVMDGSIYNKPSNDAIKAAKELREGKRIFGTDVLFFYNPKTSTSDWIFTRETVTQIGNHVFAR